MKNLVIQETEDLIDRYSNLIDLKLDINNSIMKIAQSINNNGKILVCGNGRSASDSLHIVGELMKSFKIDRKLNSNLTRKISEKFPEYSDLYSNNLQSAIPAISLVNEVSLLTAFSNDKSYDFVFAQQILGYGKDGDILICISTSGNAKNIIHATRIAKNLNMVVIALTGCDGGKLKKLSDISIIAPSFDTAQIQEYHLPIYHLPIYHCICAALENILFGVE